MKGLPKSLDPFDLRGCYLAGGAVLSAATKTPISDYDIYPKTNEDMIEIFAILLENNCFIVNITDRAVTFKSNDVTTMNDERAIVQIMTYDVFESAEKIFSNFDFTVCMGAFDCDTKKYIFHEDFYPDIASKTLRFNINTKYPLNSLLRIAKYNAKGYYMSKPEMIKVALTVIRSGMPTTWEELEDAIGGSYGREIKLNVKEDQEFSFEAAIEILSNIQNIELCLDFIEDFSHVTLEDLESMYSLEEQLIAMNSKNEYFRIDKETLLPTHKHVKAPKNHSLLSNGTRCIGYKLLKDNGDGSFAPGIYSSKNFKYKLNEEATEENHPHLFVFPSLDHAKNRKPTYAKNMKIFEVSYDVYDLMHVKPEELQVTKLKLEREVADG